MSQADPAHDDAFVLEAALYRTGACHRTDLAALLGWSGSRVDAACRQLREHLATRALALVTTGNEVRLTLRGDALDAAHRTRLEERARLRTALTAGEAARLLGLIEQRLTAPAGGPGTRPSDRPLPGWPGTVGELDRELVCRGVLEVAEGAAPWSGSALEPHPDVLFALGLCSAPTREALAARPHPPHADTHGLIDAGRPAARAPVRADGCG